jgi:hypothetical protein
MVSVMLPRLAESAGRSAAARGDPEASLAD